MSLLPLSAQDTLQGCSSVVDVAAQAVMLASEALQRGDSLGSVSDLFSPARTLSAAAFALKYVEEQMLTLAEDGCAESSDDVTP